MGHNMSKPTCPHTVIDSQKLIYVHKHKYLFASKLYLKFHLHLAGVDLNGLSLNAAYGIKEKAPRRFHCFTQYIQKRFPIRILAYAQRRLLLSVSKGFVSSCVSALLLLAYWRHASLLNDAEMSKKKPSQLGKNSETVTVSSHWLRVCDGERVW